MIPSIFLLTYRLISLFAPEGYPLIGGAVIAAAMFIATGYFMGGIWFGICVFLGIMILGFTLWFFRDPARVRPEAASDGKHLLGPADGKVVEIVEEEEPIYLKGPAKRVSIFLSPLNVHVNRVPADGEIEYIRYVPGDYLVAWHPKASEKNERSEIGMVHPGGDRILFKQIAGAVARRIVYHLEEGQQVEAGERFGVVKFGSRMDVIVPPTVQIDVEVGQRVVAGETVIGGFGRAEDFNEMEGRDEKIRSDT